MDWLSATDGVLTWLDYDRTPSDTDPTVRWTIRACRISNCQPWTVASSGTRMSLLPYPEAGSGMIAWSAPKADGRGGHPVWLYNVSTRRTTAALRTGDAVEVWISGRYLVLNGLWPLSAHYGNSPPKHKEVYVRELSGGPLHPLSSDHLVADAGVGSGYATWVNLRAGDGTEVWLAPIGMKSTGHLLGRYDSDFPLAGRGYVVVLHGGTFLRVVAMSNPSSQARLGQHGMLYIPAHYSTDGDILVYATQSVGDTGISNSPIELHIDKVTTTGP